MTEDLARKYAQLEARLKREIELREQAEECSRQAESRVRELTAQLALRRQCEIDLWAMVDFFLQTLKARQPALTEPGLLRLATMITNASNVADADLKQPALAAALVQAMLENKSSKALRERADKQLPEAERLRKDIERKAASIAVQTKRLSQLRDTFSELAQKHKDADGISGTAARSIVQLREASGQSSPADPHTGRVSVE